MAIVRGCGMLVKSSLGEATIDNTWHSLWQQIEASIAVCLVSLTAFRQLFISHGPKRERSPSNSWYSSKMRKLKGHKRNFQDEGFGQLPSIPSATLSGMRTLIQGGQWTHSLGEFDEEMLTGWRPNDYKGNLSGQVRVTNQISAEVCQVRLISGRLNTHCTCTKLSNSCQNRQKAKETMPYHFEIRMRDDQVIQAVLAVEPNKPNWGCVWLICAKSKARLAWLERLQTCVKRLLFIALVNPE
jgi:hypothetical protein